MLLLFAMAMLMPWGRAAAQEAPGAMFAVSDGRGQISLLWFPPPSQWPAGGWRLSNSSGQVLVQKIGIADAAALQTLSVEDADAVRCLPDVLAKPSGAPQQRQLFNLIGLRALTDPAYARALGLAWTLNGVAAGGRTYKVEGLDASGGPNGVQLTSAAVDAGVATGLSPAPDGVQVKADAQGVILSWSPPTEDRSLPAIAYTVERDGGGQSNAPVTAKPIIPGVRWDAKIPLLVDRNAPPNEMLTYRIYKVDAFGRRSAPATIRIFFPDFRALEPPQPVIATASGGKVLVQWPAAQKPNLAGYLVERAFLVDGPYEALFAQALPPATVQYEDDTAQGGTTYYYRVHAVDSRGDLGAPSSAAAVQAKNAGAPPKVDGLKAEAGAVRVRLTWKPVVFSVAGYFVERRVLTAASTGGPWVRLNAQVNPEPLYDDSLGLVSDAKMEYRVVAVAFDNAEGPVSDAVQVVIADRSVPEPPSIMAASGAGGTSQLSFVPAAPAEKTTQFLVLRSGREGDIGVVIGDPLPGDAHQFTDPYVKPGSSYWYRLVAVSRNGNRSDPTRPVAIRVGTPQMTRPAAPVVRYAADPYPHGELQFQMPPAGLSVIVERQEGAGGGWTRIAGPMSSDHAVDNTLPGKGAVAYRVAYLSADGHVGAASEVATLAVPAR